MYIYIFLFNKKDRQSKLSVFFRAVYSKSEEIVPVVKARETLERVMKRFSVEGTAVSGRILVKLVLEFAKPGLLFRCMGTAAVVDRLVNILLVKFPEQLFLVLGNFLRDIDRNGDILVAAHCGVGGFNASIAQAEAGSVLGAGRHMVFDLAVQSRDIKIVAENCLGIGDPDIRVDIVALAGKDGMRLYGDGELQVSLAAAVGAEVALSAHGEDLVVVNAGRNIDRQLDVLADHAKAFAAGARVLDDGTAAVALRALTRGLEQAERRSLLGRNLASTVALRTGLRVAGMGAGTAADIAVHNAGNRDRLLAALGRLLKCKSNTGLDITARAGCVGVGAALLTAEAAKSASAENAGEDIADIAEIRGAEAAAESASAGIRVKCRVAESVILRLLIRIAQNFIGLIDLFELCLCFRVVGVQVGVILLGQLAVCFFYLCVGRALVNAENLVVIAFLCQG